MPLISAHSSPSPRASRGLMHLLYFLKYSRSMPAQPAPVPAGRRAPAAGSRPRSPAGSAARRRSRDRSGSRGTPPSSDTPNRTNAPIMPASTDPTPPAGEGSRLAAMPTKKPWTRTPNGTLTPKALKLGPEHADVRGPEAHRAAHRQRARAAGRAGRRSRCARRWPRWPGRWPAAPGCARGGSRRPKEAMRRSTSCGIRAISAKMP